MQNIAIEPDAAGRQPYPNRLIEAIFEMRRIYTDLQALKCDLGVIEQAEARIEKNEITSPPLVTLVEILLRGPEELDRTRNLCLNTIEEIRNALI